MIFLKCQWHVLLQVPYSARHEFFGGILLSVNQSHRIVQQLRDEDEHHLESHHPHRVKRKIRPFDLSPEYQWKMPIYFQFDGTHGMN